MRSFTPPGLPEAQVWLNEDDATPLTIRINGTTVYTEVPFDGDGADDHGRASPGGDDD